MGGAGLARVEAREGSEEHAHVAPLLRRGLLGVVRRERVQERPRRACELLGRGWALDVEVRRRAGTATCTAGAVPGEVRWSGASFVVAPGRTLRLEGLLGEPFAPKATPAAPATPVGP